MHHVIDSVQDNQQKFSVIKLASRIDRAHFIFDLFLACKNIELKPEKSGIFPKDMPPLTKYEQYQISRYMIQFDDYNQWAYKLLTSDQQMQIQQCALAYIKKGCILYSIVESAKLNGLIPFEYLKYLLEVMPTMKLNEENLDKILPWAKELPNHVKTPCGRIDFVEEK